MALTKDLVDNPAIWRLSMQVCSHTLEVFAHPLAGDAPGVCASVAYDVAAASPAAAFEEAVYANPMLLLPFSTVDIVVDNSRAMVVAAGTSTEAVRKLLRLPESETLRETPIDSRNSLVYSLGEPLGNFIGRTFDTAKVSHTLAVLCRYHTLKGRRSNTSNMIVNLGNKSADILVFNRFGLVMARHFDEISIDDAAYYILAIFKQAQLDAETDELLIAGNSTRRMKLAPILGRFVSLVLPAIFPSALYHGDSTALKAPYPLGILPALRD